MSKNSFFLGEREIGYSSNPLVIAEIGINHGGSLVEAKKIVDAAISAGAEVIKHQTHVVDDEMISVAKEIVPENASESIYDIMENCALGEVEEAELKEYIEKKGAIYLSTPFSRKAADRLQKMNVCGFKIGSGECNNHPLIEHVASFGKPIILSTGMNGIADIKKSVDILDYHNVDYALLHCTNIYPTPFELVRLGAMQEMQKAFPEALIGLSDHTTSNLACLGAIALGACIVERHFTDSMGRGGPDIANSMDPNSLSELIEQGTLMAKMRGGSKGALKEESGTIDFAFASVVSVCDIALGETLTKDNIWVKRPGTGAIPAADYSKVLGKLAIVDIPSDTFLSPDQIADMALTEK